MCHRLIVSTHDLHIELSRLPRPTRLGRRARARGRGAAPPSPRRPARHRGAAGAPRARLRRAHHRRACAAARPPPPRARARAPAAAPPPARQPRGAAPARPGGAGRRGSSSRSSSRCCRSRRPAPSPTATPGRCRSSRCWCCCASRGGARAAGPCGGLVADHPALIAVQRGVAVLTMALIATQFFLAGAAAFGATSFDAHKAVGSALVLVVLLAVLVPPPPRRFVAHAAALLGLTILQLVLGTVGADEPWVGAFH